MSAVTNLPKTRIQQYTPAQPAVPPTAQVTQVYLQPAQLLPGMLWKITIIDAGPPSETHVASYQSLPTDGTTEIINGILAAFDPTVDDFFSQLVVTADYDLRILTIVSPGFIIVQATVTPPFSKWELVAFPYALAEPVIRGAYSDALREAGQTDKAMAEEQGAVADVTDRVTKALAPGYNDLTDHRAPAPRYRGKLQGQGPPK
jgi:hypothetical protein